ncbi:Protein-lysine N-methyltransferase mettl10 [Armadillidium vulgare]|nr:Protein-lysine N-methyltransferase mettl10 [Armadillidium vulgare]
MMGLEALELTKNINILAALVRSKISNINWDESYKKDLINFEKYGDIGDIWFGEESMLRIIKWITSSSISHSSRIIDIGCGNGIFLSYLADEGFNNLFGVDYSEDAIILAKSIAYKRETPIHFEVANIASNDFKNGTNLKKPFDVVHDKGTFDAISLCPNDAKLMMQTYIQNIVEILADEGFYILTSCNWTEKELISKFSYCKYLIFIVEKI